MVVLQATAVMVVVVIMDVAVPVIMIVIVMMIIGIEERRLDFENAIEIKGIAAEDFTYINLGALGAMFLGLVLRTGT